MTMPTGLPVAEVLDDLVADLGRVRAAVLEAPPGAGKTTLVPLALRTAPWADGRIVVLEPRRIAARAAAARMASLDGSRLGDVVGFTTGEDRRVSADTEVEVVTEGVLVARLLRDPLLEGVSAVVLDEFHERSAEADLALAFALEVMTTVRDDLRLLVMSATLDGQAVLQMLEHAGVGDVAHHRSDGRMYDVETTHRTPPADPRALPGAVADAAVDALACGDGDVLCFLPGVREIRATCRALAQRLGADVAVLPLHGTLPADEQQAVLVPRSGGRRVIVATDIAESSVTVPGVRAVVDAGLARRPQMDLATGMSRLTTIRIARSNADQRRGRAAREGPGRCVRLWPRTRQLEAHAKPAILASDLVPTALSIAAWGTPVDELALLDRPDADAWDAAIDTLRDLGAVAEDGRVTEHGRRLSALPTHPRLGNLLLRAAPQERGLAADVAAILGERDLLIDGGTDLADRVAALHGRPHAGAVRRSTLHRARDLSRRLRRTIAAGSERPDPAQVAAHLGLLVARAFPERVAQARPHARGSYLLATGRGAVLDDRDPLATEALLAVAAVDLGARQARIHQAAALSAEDAERLATTSEVVAWMPREAGGPADVVAESRTGIGAVVLRRHPLPDPDPAAIRRALLSGLATDGLDLLRWGRASVSLRQRLAFLHSIRPTEEGWPSMAEDDLLAEVDTWLGPFLLGARRRADLDRVDLAAALRSRVPHELQRQVDSLAPVSLRVPSGADVRLDYASGEPVLAVKLQEMFGATETPTVAGVPVLLHLLSPARRPLQVTRDLAGFWDGSYAQVRAEMRGRYPKHPWPEDPLTATPTARTKRAMARDDR